MGRSGEAREYMYRLESYSPIEEALEVCVLFIGVCQSLFSRFGKVQVSRGAGIQ